MTVIVPIFVWGFDHGEVIGPLLAMRIETAFHG
jgi:hypothetical protein